MLTFVSMEAYSDCWREWVIFPCVCFFVDNIKMSCSTLR